MAGLPGALPPMGNFDPAGFTEGKSVAELKMLREAEVTHGRVSMLASLGFLVQESFHPLFRLGDKDIGPAIRHLDEVRAVNPAFFEGLTFAIACAELGVELLVQRRLAREEVDRTGAVGGGDGRLSKRFHGDPRLCTGAVDAIACIVQAPHDTFLSGGGAQRLSE